MADVYEVTGLNCYGYHFGGTFDHEYYARQYLERKKALSTTLSLALWVNGEVVESYESQGNKLVRVK